MRGKEGGRKLLDKGHRVKRVSGYCIYYLFLYIFTGFIVCLSHCDSGGGGHTEYANAINRVRHLIGNAIEFNLQKSGNQTVVKHSVI